MPVNPTDQQEFSDADFRVVDNGDQSKKLAFQVSGVTTGTTRTLTVRDADGTVGLTSDIEDAIADSVTTKAPSQNAVFDALALKVPTSRTISAGGIATGGGDLIANRTITVTAATQSDQETGTSTTVAVVPGVQHFHPSACKSWARFNSAGTIAASYNVASITDNGVGDWSVNIGTDFSSANYSASAFTGWKSGVGVLLLYASIQPTEGAFQISASQDLGGTAADPTAVDLIMFQAFGDQ